MYIRKLYEPEDKLRLQIPGHGTGSAAGSAAQQEVRGKVTQSRSPQAQAAASGAAQGGRRYTTKTGLPSLYVPEENTWLSRGSFGDGYQFGDVARGITGTMLETSENVFTGALRVAENAVDAVAGRAAKIKPLERPLTEFVKKDLIDEEKLARGYTKYWSLPGWAGMAFSVDPDRDSFLGDKGEALAQSAGQLALTAGANSVGIPGDLITGVTSYGSEVESALRAGATPKQANASATISALGEVITEKGFGAIKFGGKALDDALVDNLTDGISNKVWKTLAKAGLGGIGEGNEEIASEVISRLGQWLTYQNDKTIREMLLSGEAREAYLDSFLGGLALGAPAGAVDTVLSENDGSTPKKTQGKPLQNQTTGPNTDVLTQPQVTKPGETGKTTTASRPDDAPRRVLLTEPEGTVDTTIETNKPATAPKTPQIQPEAAIPDTAQDTPKTQTDIPYYTTDTWTNDLNGVWTDTDAVDTNADSAVTPVRYEDALRDYLGKGTEPTAVLNTGSDAEPSVPQEAAPKPKEQIISELAPKIRTSNMTPGRAMIAAEQTYADAEKRFGANASAVLEQIEPGQNPRKFLDGFQNAYLAGKLGDKAALENSTAAAYLTEEQKKYAYEIGLPSITKKAIEKSEKRGKIEYIEAKGNVFSASVSTGGHRNESPLMEAQIVEAQKAARRQGFDGEVFYSDYSSTAFHGSAEGHGFCFLVVGTDAYPSLDGKSANERVSVDGCMAHEVVGHYEAWLKGTTQSDPVLEEAQASIRASKFGVGLSTEERVVLFEDAMDRLDRVGISFEQIKDKLDIWER